MKTADGHFEWAYIATQDSKVSRLYVQRFIKTKVRRIVIENKDCTNKQEIVLSDDCYRTLLRMLRSFDTDLKKVVKE
jgi:hypothetical protein